MKSNSERETISSLLKVIPAKWAIVIIASLIVYVVLQPRLNEWFGWNLPSVGSSTSEEPAKAKRNAEAKSTNIPKFNTSEVVKNASEIDSISQYQAKGASKSNESPKSSSSASAKEGDSPKSGTESRKSSKNTSKSAEGTNGSEPAKKSSTAKGKVPPSVEDYLTEVGTNRFESPKGLLYNPGSEEGHRLKHIERHLTDIPNRPGPHGVFEGSMVEFLIAIDDAVNRAKQKAKGTSMKEDDGAVVYEATFDKPIGFLGGEDGKRKRNPKIKKMRVVLRNDAVITAFPF